MHVQNITTHTTRSKQAEQAHFFLYSYNYYSIISLETKLSPEQSRKVIGELHNVMESCVRIEKLAPFLERRRILDLRQCGYFVSQNALDPDHETRKLNELVMKLQRAADFPEGECVRSLYLSLCDVSEQDDLASAQQHRHVASYLRKQGNFETISLHQLKYVF